MTPDLIGLLRVLSQAHVRYIIVGGAETDWAQAGGRAKQGS